MWSDHREKTRAKRRLLFHCYRNPSIVCVPLVLGVYQFGMALGEPAVGLVLAVFVLQEIVWDVGPIIWKE